MRKILIIIAVSLGLMALISCSGKRGHNGATGPGGDGGDSAYVYTVTSAPSVGTCYKISNSIWVENENNEIDVYNNSDCNHGPSPKTEYCDDYHEHEVCGVGGFMIWFEGFSTNMKLHIFNFNVGG